MATYKLYDDQYTANRSSSRWGKFIRVHNSHGGVMEFRFDNLQQIGPGVGNYCETRRFHEAARKFKNGETS